MEIQTTEFENAAFTVFIVLLSRVIISYGLDFLVPISKLGWYRTILSLIDSDCRLSVLWNDPVVRLEIVLLFEINNVRKVQLYCSVTY